MKSPRLMRMAAVATLGIGLGGVTIGCRSAVSTHVIPCPDGVGWEQKRIRGVPVMVKLPSHVEVVVFERRYVTSDGKSLCCDELKTRELVTKHVEYNKIEKDEVFVVDSVRPAAGTLAYSATFNGQFFKTFNSKIEDKTIEEITKIVNALPKPPIPGAKAAASASGSNISEIDRILVVKVFAITDPQLECNIQDFVNGYLNDCTIPCTSPNSCGNAVPKPPMP